MTPHALRTLPLNADCAEFCINQQHRDVLAAGSYQLDEGTQQRAGSIHLYRLSLEQPLPVLTDLSTLGLPGVFDMRWHPTEALLAAALADGSVRQLALQDGTLEQTAEAPGPAAGSMAVSVDYSRCAPSAGDTLCVSYSCGRLQHIQAGPAQLRSLVEWQAHTLEAWAAAWHYWSADVIFSGGDDCAFRVWDLRQGVAAAAWTDRRTHAAGVCCVASSPCQDHVVCTGSYDEKVRLWDLRMLHRPALQQQASCFWNLDGFQGKGGLHNACRSSQSACRPARYQSPWSAL